MENIEFELIFEIIAAIALAVAAGGGLLAIFDRLRGDVALKTTLERVAVETVPAPVLLEVNGTLQKALSILQKVVVPAVEYVEDITDGLPEEEFSG
jgi:hypothetical protein